MGQKTGPLRKSGKIRSFRGQNNFRAKVLAIVAAIEVGKTLTYGQVAKLAGNARAARAVGSILHANYDPRIPCHRVIGAGQKIGGYNRGLRKKSAD